MILPTSNFNIPPESFEGRMMREIQAAMQKEIEATRERIITEAVKTFEADLRKNVGRFAVDLANYYTIERVGEMLVIMVKIEALK